MSAQVLDLRLRGSTLAGSVLAAGHGLAGVALWLSAMPRLWALLGSVGLAASAAWAWWRAHQPPLARLCYDGERWTLIGVKQQVWHGELLGSTWCSRWLTLLHFRLQNRRFLAVPIWRDSLLDDDYRRLQVVLRWQVRFKR